MDNLGQTPLHRASQSGQVQACRMLLQAGADASICSLQGYTAAQIGTEAVQKVLEGKDVIVSLSFFMPVQ